MAPKKPTVTSSSTRSARIKGGSNPVVTKGEARTRAARTSLGPAPKQRPMATGGTKGPLQGGTRTTSVAKPSGMTMSGDRGAAIKGAGNPAGPRAPKPAFGPVPTGPSERRIRSMEAGPGKVRAGMGGGTTLSSKPGANAAGAQAAKDAARMSNRAAKGYGQPGKMEAGIRRAAGMGMTAARIARGVTPAGVAYETLKPRSLANEPNANITRFANARNMAFAKAKGIKGSPVLGAKKSVAASFDSAFAAARKAGKSGFTFKGKKYTTKMK